MKIKNSHEPWIGQRFLKYDSNKVQMTRKYISTGLHQKVKLCILKDIISKVKRKHIEWKKKIFANHIFDKIFVAIIYSKLLPLK